jgi:ABC-type hemin transport system ATPase subunit/GNAT superfamily N-acetyltransferase
MRETNSISGDPSERALEVAAMFDIDLESESAAPRDCSGEPVSRKIRLPQGGVVFLTGPSGAGKTRLLRALADHLRAGESSTCVLELAPPGTPARTVIDCLEGLPLARALRLLARAGLAEAPLMVRSPQFLSDGERFRLALAQLFAQVEIRLNDLEERAGARSAVLLADEFCSCLDRATARTIARNARRWIAETRHTLVVASAHDDLLESLNPDVLVITSLNGRVEVHRKNSSTFAERDNRAASCCGEVIVEDGSIADYDLLARHHYRAGRPATLERIFRLVRSGSTIAGRFFGRRRGKETIGVLVRSFPTLSCAMRERALGGRYRGLSPRERAAIISSEVRTISRVVIDPRYRGTGLASRLVRHALDHPSTAVTEALAAMGEAHPFFERAGMTRIDPVRRAEDARLLDALAHVGVALRGVIDLVLTNALAERIESLDHDRRAWIDRELERWRAKHDGPRRLSRPAEQDAAIAQRRSDTLRLARRAIASRPVYYIAIHDA